MTPTILFITNHRITATSPSNTCVLPLLRVFHQQHERLLEFFTNNGFGYEKGINEIDPLPNF